MQILGYDNTHLRRTLQILVGLFWPVANLFAQPVAPSSTSTSIFSPASTPADSIFGLSLFVFGVTGVIFLIVSALLVYSAVKFRKRADDDGREPPQVYGSNQLELAWTVIPVLIVVVLFLATARVIHEVQDAPRPPGAIEVTVVGHQFWWEFRYPQYGFVATNELHVPVSEPKQPTPTFLMLLSADTDHSFWVPRLAGKTDLIPNHPNSMWIDPHETGVYLGQCAQYCGTQHAKMLLRVYVEPRRLRPLGAGAAAARGGERPAGCFSRRRPARVRGHGVRQLPRGRGHGGERTIWAGPDPPHESRHTRLRRRAQHVREPSALD